MKVFSASEARAELASIMREVCDDHSPAAISGESGDAVVLLSLEDYRQLKETVHLLDSPENARRLFESIAELENNIEVSGRVG